VLGDLEVVVADRLDRAVDTGAVHEGDPDRLPPPGELAEGEHELIRWMAGRGVGRSTGGSAGSLNEMAGP